MFTNKLFRTSSLLNKQFQPKSVSTLVNLMKHDKVRFTPVMTMKASLHNTPKSSSTFSFPSNETHDPLFKSPLNHDPKSSGNVQSENAKLNSGAISPFRTEFLKHHKTPAQTWNKLFGIHEDYVSMSCMKYENANYKHDVDYLDFGISDSLHYYLTGTGALLVCLLCAGMVLLSFFCLAFYSNMETTAILNRSNPFPYFERRHNGDRPLHPFFMKFIHYSLQPSDVRTLFYNEIEWAINERKQMDMDRQSVKDSLKNIN